jgi:hypothetical protein
MRKDGMRTQPHLAMDKVHGSYSLQVEHPRGGKKTIETYASMPAVVARATELLQAGYSVGIWSPVSLEER